MGIIINPNKLVKFIPESQMVIVEEAKIDKDGKETKPAKKSPKKDAITFTLRKYITKKRMDEYSDYVNNNFKEEALKELKPTQKDKVSYGWIKFWLTDVENVMDEDGNKLPCKNTDGSISDDFLDLLDVELFNELSNECTRLLHQEMFLTTNEKKV